MLRQVWVFLDAEDEERLVERLSADVPLRRLHGRYFRGTADDLRGGAVMETASPRAGERRTQLIHPGVSRLLVVHALTEGPWAGWSRLDETLSEVVTIVRPEPRPGELNPSRIQAATHVRAGDTKQRKSPEFVRWVGQVMKTAAGMHPATGYEWLRAGPGALRGVEQGRRLRYLFRDVPLAGSGGPPARTGPGAGGVGLAAPPADEEQDGPSK